MASVKNGLSENIKGRLGNVIFYSRLGRTYARLRPPKGHDRVPSCNSSSVAE